MKQNATVLTIETDFGKAFFFLPTSFKKKSLLYRSSETWSTILTVFIFSKCSYIFEKKLVFALWLGKIIILLVTLLKPYAGS